MQTVKGEEYRANKGGVELFLWRKRPLPGTEVAGRPPVVLVHGSSLSALPTFDLTVPGHADYSFMDWLARRGFDVWTLDHEGYGHSSITESNSDIASGADDLAAAAPVIAEACGHDRFHFYGMSSGALRAAAFAERAPEHVARLVLDGFVWTGEGSPTLAKRRENADFFRIHNRRPLDRAFVESIFTRDKPGTSEAAVMKACADAQLAYADSVPTGTYLDMTTRLPLVDPEKIAAPVMVLRGEYDGIASLEDICAFFKKLPNGDKRLVVLPGLAHVTPLGLKRHLMWETVEAFLDAPRAGARA